MFEVVGGRSVLGSQKVPSWAAKRFCGTFTKVPPRFSPRNGQQPQGSQECSNCGHTSSPRRKQRQSTQAHKHVPTEGTQARQGAGSGKAPRLTSVFQLRAHKLAKAQAAAKHQGSQECSNGHTSLPGRMQRQSTQAHKHVPTEGTQARQGAGSGKAPRLTSVFQLRAHKLAKAQAAAKHPGSQACSN